MEGTQVGSAGMLAGDRPQCGCAGCLGGSQPVALGWVARLQFIYRSNKPTLEVPSKPESLFYGAGKASQLRLCQV